MEHFRMPENPKVSPGRLMALRVTQEVRLRDAFAHNVLEAALREANEEGRPLSPEDRGFATTLVLGVTQTRGTLDDVINRALDNPHDVKPNVRDALRISTYEIVYLEKSSHAAVDQGVELVRSVVPRAAGLANAVLRRVVKLAREFPFGDPARDMAAFARQQGFPGWLAQQLVADLGSEAARAHMQVSNQPAPLFLAGNAVKMADARELEGILDQMGCGYSTVVLRGCEIPGCVRVDDSHAIADGRIKRLIAQGKLLVSDASAQSIALLAAEGALACCKRAKGEDATPSVLEIGAGRATKTILLQSQAVRLAGRQFQLTTVDNQAFKVDLLKRRAKDYGAQVFAALEGDGTALDNVVGSTEYDCVFLDTPCTGLGTLRRHPEIRWRIAPRDIAQAAKLSAALLHSAAAHVAVGGMLVYATCTVTQAENAQVVQGFLRSEAGANFKVVPINGHAAFASVLAPESPDAHFAVRMVRVS
ncbi:MAG: transcription antitermination factor NusB [Coriobacteriia bacterium]|nr:transcription antitermination factor NusB [Coriobacteriia bacterium]